MLHRIEAVLLILMFLTAFRPPARLALAGETHPLIRFYQNHISAIDGNRCPMTPSCSEYAAQAIEKHGPVMGWIMACDRLMRCGRDETLQAPPKKVNGHMLFHDPVENNDFWWFKGLTTDKGIKAPNP